MAIPPPPPLPVPHRTSSPSPAPPPSPSLAAPAVCSANQLATALANNQLRLKAIAERLALYFRGGLSLTTNEVFHLIFTLARGIDYALSGNDVPGISRHLPSLIKQAYQHRNDHLLQSAVMVLMISAKNACNNRWFLKSDADELLNMANELCNSFCMSINATDIGSAIDTISKIMPRFYPQLRFHHLIVLFEAKPGYDILMADFPIGRNITTEERIRLLVVQRENLDTSSCIISPQQVSFLVNGKAVEKRTNVSMETGPQFPTDITKMLKYGTNIIQAVGYFTGNYIIAVAFMGTATPPDASRLEDYVHPVVAKPLSDSEIIEGASRITLNCPISCKRIKTPVKGQHCKHHQCFDYENYLELNLRKPVWRCPCCNTPASCVDLRLDQNMVKILREVGEVDVVISADGSCKGSVEHNPSMKQSHNGRLPEQQGDIESERSASGNIVDLTMEEDGTKDIPMNSEVHSLPGPANLVENGSSETEDRKPFKDDHGFPLSLYLSEPAVAMITQAAAFQARDVTRNMPLTSSSGSLARTCGPNVHALGTLESLVPDVLNPIQTDAVSSSFLQDPAVTLDCLQSDMSCQNRSQERHLLENMQVEQSHTGGSLVPSDVGRPLITRNVIRTPIAIQALPAQNQAASSSRRMQTNLLSSSAIPASLPSSSCQPLSPLIMASGGFNTVNNELEIEQRSRTSSLASSSLPQQPMMQSRHNRENLQFSQSASLQQVVGLSTPNQIGTRSPQDQLRGAVAYRTTVQTPLESQNSTQVLNQMRHLYASPASIPRPSRVPPVYVQHASQVTGLQMTTTEASRMLSTQRAQAAMMLAGAARQLQAPRVATGLAAADDGGVVASARSEGMPALPSEQNWQPTGRMRGSLTGSAYAAALSQYMVPQPAKPRRPPSQAAGSGSDNPSTSNACGINEQGSTAQQANVNEGGTGSQSGGSSF